MGFGKFEPKKVTWERGMPLNKSIDRERASLIVRGLSQDRFIGALPVGVVLLILFPILVYKIYPPETKNSKGVPPWAAQE